MVSHMMGMTSCFDNHLIWLPSQLGKLNLENIPRLNSTAASKVRLAYQRLNYPNVASSGKYSVHHLSWRTFSVPVNVEEEPSSLPLGEYSSNDDDVLETSPEELLEQPSSSDELWTLKNIQMHKALTCYKLKALLADAEREKLIRKLSEANQQNRFLKRQLHAKEEELVNFKSQLATMELEMQALVTLAEEMTNLAIPEGSRKINGRYIQCHLLLRLEAVHEKLKDQIKDVEAAQFKEVSLLWYGMAESVLVMGTFDGWSQGEHLSPEPTGSYTKFSTTLMLRPGRYEIKFLVDGEWQLSPEFPTVGEGLMENNLLIVE